MRVDTTSGPNTEPDLFASAKMDLVAGVWAEEFGDCGLRAEGFQLQGISKH